jgi:proteasome lid subunit RPN8/RPN11
MISKKLVNQILKHAEEEYDNECCGFLLGITDKDENIFEIVKTENVNTENKKNRYTIDPFKLIETEDYAEQKGWEMIGVYHSHPNNPAKPSKYDLEHSFKNFLYIVVSVNQGKATNINCWKRKDAEVEEFYMKPMIITDV